MNWLERRWYSAKPPILLTPLSRLFLRLAKRRRQQYATDASRVWRAPVPVVIVGNITVGGTGKTPLVVYLVELLLKQGLKPAVISRGYGGDASAYPLDVTEHVLSQACGDEPKLIQQRCGCPVVVDPIRKRAGEYVMANYDCDVIISDDGLQHYALARDIEIAVIDGQRGLGNGACLPAGPLREPKERLNECDFIVQNGVTDTPVAAAAKVMRLVSDGIYTVASLQQGAALQLRSFEIGTQVVAMAGIGNPQRFFAQLERDYGLKVEGVPLADHYDFSKGLPLTASQQPIIVTEKDAVKLVDIPKPIGDNSLSYLRVSAKLPNSFDATFLALLSERSQALNSSGLRAPE